MKKLPAAAAAAATLAASPALAHHPLSGEPMTTFAHGLLSGVGHPILGFDHLFFVALMGIAAVYTGRALAAPAAYVAAMAAGVVLTTAGLALPMIETVVALSLLALGAIVLSGRALRLPAALAVFAGFGLFHGAAFGGALAGAEAGAGLSVLAGYLIALAIVQYTIALVAGGIARNVWHAADSTALQPRLAGAVVAGAGLLLTLERAEGALLATLGWG